MPWSNQNGGGWKGGGNGGPWGSPGGGNNGGPWGQGPQRGGGNQPPDLEELLRRTQDKLRNVFPGGPGPMLIVILAIVGIVLLWSAKAIYQVQPDELGVELVLGKPKKEFSTQGIHFHWWPIETVEKVKIIENKEEIGSFVNNTTGRRTNPGQASGLMLSGDQNIVNVDFSVLWRVSDPSAYLFNVRDPSDLVRRVAESAMREIVGRRPAEDVFRRQREGIENDVKTLMQSSLDSYGAGIMVSGVKLEAAEPPAEVADAFEEVQRAEQDEDRFKREAERYQNQRLGEARGKASQIREEAKGYKEQVTKQAEGEAQRFISVYNEYVKAKDVTKKRLFLETMERVLNSSQKVIIEGGSKSGVVPYLPLNELTKGPRAETAKQ